MRLLTPLILLLASIGLLYYFAKPQYDQVTVVRDQIRQYDDAISRAQQVGTKRNDLLSRRNSFSPTHVQRLEKALPDSIDQVRLIIDMSTLASRYGSNISNITMSKVEMQNPNSIGPDMRPYGTLSMSFGVTMPYEQFQRYLMDLERSLRIIDITALSLTPSDTGSLYKYSLTLSTYWLK